MKLSTLNKIEHYFWIIWRIVVILLAIYSIYYVSVLFLFKSPIVYTVVNTETIKEVKTDCDFDKKLKSFSDKYGIISLEWWSFERGEDEQIWLNYDDEYKGKTVDMKKKLKNFTELSQFLDEELK